jgi:hypothetical protein
VHFQTTTKEDVLPVKIFLIYIFVEERYGPSENVDCSLVIMRQKVYEI